MLKTVKAIWEFLQIVLISLIIIIPIRYYVIQPFFVKGSSMEPNFHDKDYLLIDEISYHIRAPKRGEVVIFRFPQNTKQFYIKRIIGLPGETIMTENGNFIVYNQENSQGLILEENDYLANAPDLRDINVTLEDNEYYVLGDNRLHSFDSRRWGPLEEEYIIGRALLRVWPLDQATAFAAPSYNIN